MYNVKFLELQLSEDNYECQVIILESILGPQEGNIMSVLLLHKSDSKALTYLVM